MEWAHKLHFLEKTNVSYVYKTKTLRMLPLPVQNSFFLNTDFYSVSFKYLLESHCRCTCIQSLLQLCVSDWPQTYPVGISSLVLSPAPAVLLWPPWMDPITLSHLGCKSDLFLCPSLLCPSCSDTVGSWSARALPLLQSPLTSFLS